MPLPSIEKRLSDLEEQVAALMKEKTQASEQRWWHRHFGAFKDDPTFEEATRLGAEYRKSQPNAADNPEAFTG